MTWKCTNTPKGDNKLYSDAKGVVPSLDLRFAEGKTLNDYMTGQNLITFSRPVGANQSPGTYVDENGIIQLSSADTPRFDHDPTTGESLGLLIEESRTNLVTYSEQFDNAAWVKSGDSAVTADQTVAPDGTTTADLLTCSNAGPNRVTNLVSVSASTDYTATVFVKSGDRTHLGIRLYIFGGTFVDLICNFEFASGTFSYISGPGTLSATPYPNGWYRLTITIGTGNNTSLEFRLGGAYINEGTGTTAYLWGAQLEAGSFPTSYIPTTGTALTRSADVASITGTNFSSWYNPNQGTIYAKNTYQGTGIQKSFWTLKDSLNNSTDYIGLVVKTSGQLRAASNKAGALQLFINGIGAITEGDNVHTAVALQENNCAFCTDGGSVLPDTTVLLSDNLERLLIGYLYDPTVQQLTGHIARLTYFPERLPDSSLQTMTTP